MTVNVTSLVTLSAAPLVDDMPPTAPISGDDGFAYGFEWSAYIRDTFDAEMDALLRSFRQSKAEVLEVGCASGVRAEDFARAGHRVTAVDITDQGHAIARRNRDLRQHRNTAIDFYQGNILDPEIGLPLDRFFDVAHCNRVTHFLNLPWETPAFFATMHGLLKNDGYLLMQCATLPYVKIGNKERQPSKTIRGTMGCTEGYIHDPNSIIDIAASEGFRLQAAQQSWNTSAFTFRKNPALG